MTLAAVKRRGHAPNGRAPAISGRRLVLLAVAALLSAVGLLAIGILLFGDFGGTEGRILGTTAVLAGYALLALPAAILVDQRRLPQLAATVIALALAGAALAMVGIWQDGAGDDLGRTIGTVTVWLVATTQVAALAARRREQDSRVVRALFAASSALAAVVAAMFTALVWAEPDSEGYARVFAALIVLDVLLVALQPILARARPTERAYPLRLLIAPDETVEVLVEASDLAAAAAKAIRAVERDGRTVLRLEPGHARPPSGGRL